MLYSIFLHILRLVTLINSARCRTLTDTCLGSHLQTIYRSTCYCDSERYTNLEIVKIPLFCGVKTLLKRITCQIQCSKNTESVFRYVCWFWCPFRSANFYFQPCEKWKDQLIMVKEFTFMYISDYALYISYKQKRTRIHVRNFRIHVQLFLAFP